MVTQVAEDEAGRPGVGRLGPQVGLPSSLSQANAAAAAWVDWFELL